ncbi:hypothetical protein BOTBODRAFT_176282 [Botryobasidium botryosum FD-172 SS1]|uniref:Glyoxal oxidase n=1 Tax=Botryobasidium botryosum (strain FD-172 SS1) TaxID=930990 RepID=A0A067MD13_BOTB1|nr:hypothetical protein BOTBODRAFT_176282 [Botryobasidium botryosum FD-172 SS1]
MVLPCRNICRKTVSLLSITAWVRAANILPPLGQPTKSGSPGQFEYVGESGVSGQQIFLGTPNKVFIIDKTEGNTMQVAEHPAWASEYDIRTNSVRPMDVLSSTFCAGGSVLGNGTWMNVGGNQAVTTNGDQAASQTGGGPYDDWDGRKAVRFFTPCDDGSCNWIDDPKMYMDSPRWYPTLETLENGSIIIIGGCINGGFVNGNFVNDAGQNNPTYEFYPSTGPKLPLGILNNTLPANLFPLTWLLPSGKLFIQSNWGAEIFDYKKAVETTINNIPHAVRTYPASAATAMLPLTPANNWTATIVFCGGSNVQPDQWFNQTLNFAAYPTDSSCVRITPDVSHDWSDDDSLPEGRSMGSFIALPDGTFFLGNGANTGVAGYGVNISWTIGHSYADHPIFSPLIYNPNAPSGSRFSREGLGNSTIPRMYHSSATLLPDGSIFVTGSNPNPDYTVGPNVAYPTEYRVERFYPSYYSKTRPNPQGILDQLSYGGSYFNVTLALDDLAGDYNNVKSTTVVVIRPGFSTHAMNMGMRFVQLETSYTVSDKGGITLHVSQLPPNPAIIAPGPAMIFVVVNGVPSVGQFIMLGTGQLGTQPTLSPQALPVASLATNPSPSSPHGVEHRNSASAIYWQPGAVIAIISVAVAVVLTLIS